MNETANVISFVIFHEGLDLSFINFTDAAILQIKQIIVDQELSTNATFIRLDLREIRDGKLSFSLYLEDQFDNERDDIQSQACINFVYKKELREYLSQVTIDYKKQENNEGFILHSVQNMSLTNFDV